RRTEPDARVVMITKSEEDRTLMEAIGRRVDDYLVKPATPRQVLSVATRLLEGAQLRQQQAAQDFAARFAALTRLRNEATSWQDYFSLYHELVNWDLRLHDAGETALADSVAALMMDVRREFGALVVREYAGWVGAADGGGRDGARLVGRGVDEVRARRVRRAGRARVRGRGRRGGRPRRPPGPRGAGGGPPAALGGRGRAVRGAARGQGAAPLRDHRLPPPGPVARAAPAVGRGVRRLGGAVPEHPPHGDAVRAQRDLQRPVPGLDRARAAGVVGHGGGQSERVRGRA